MKLQEIKEKTIEELKDIILESKKRIIHFKNGTQ